MGVPWGEAKAAHWIGMHRSYVSCSMSGTDLVFFSVRSLNRHQHLSLRKNRLLL